MIQKYLHDLSLSFLNVSVALLICCLSDSQQTLFAGSLTAALKNYKVGVDYSTSRNFIKGQYRSDLNPQAVGSNICNTDEQNTSKMLCDVGMNAGGSSGFGFFIQRAFKRKALIHFDADIGFGIRYLKGSLSAEDEANAAFLPLRQLSFSLFATVIKPYFQVGITPQKTWPDILLSVGPTLQVAAGSVSVNNTNKTVLIGSSSEASLSGILTGFFELELVFIRFGDGAFSCFLSREFTSSSMGSKLYPGSIDGMDQFKADFYRSVGGNLAFGFGLKLLLNWP